MKRLIFLGLTLLVSGAVYALPLGNPSEASLMCDGLVYEGHCADFCQPGVSFCDAWSFRVGFYGDYVFERHLEAESKNRTEDDIETFALYTNAGYLAFNLWDRVDLFGTLGATNYRLEANASSFRGISGQRLVIESETGFSWSLGLRGTLWECGCLAFGAEAQYFYTKPNIRVVYSQAKDELYPDNRVDMKYQEWQVGLGASYRIWNFVPYMGVKYSNVKVDGDDATLELDPSTAVVILLRGTNTKLKYGYVVGVSLVDCEKASLTLEARFPDEEAVHVRAQIRF